MNLDRFEVGLFDQQAARPVGRCEACGREIYKGDEIRSFEGELVHEDCLMDFVDQISESKLA